MMEQRSERHETNQESQREKFSVDSYSDWRTLVRLVALRGNLSAG